MGAVPRSLERDRQPGSAVGLSQLGNESGVISLCYPTETGLWDAAREVLITKTIWYTGGLSLGAGPAGRAIVGSSGGDDVYVVDATPLGAPWTSLARASGTVFALIRRIGNAVGNAPVFGVFHPSHSPYSTMLLYDRYGTGNMNFDGSPGGSYTNFALSAMTNGALEFWVGTYDGAAGRLYKNGVLVATSGAVSGALTVATQFDAAAMNFGQGALNRTFNGEFYLGGISPKGWSPEFVAEVSRNPWSLAAPEQIYVPMASGATDYPVTATDALTLADSASQSFAATGVAAEAMTLADSASQAFAATGVATDAMTLADSASNVAALGAVASDALTLAESASNVAALSATATDALTLADTLNATASGDYTAIGSDALTLADAASNVAALSATGSDALTLADAASNAAALGATASDALTLADTLNASASGDYVVTATDALSLSDSVVAAYAAICIATDALTLADATSAAMAGEYAATATDALTLADAASNAAALGVSISEALTLAALVSAMTAGELTIDMPRTRRLGGAVARRSYRLGGPVAGRRQRLGGPITKE